MRAGAVLVTAIAVSYLATFVGYGYHLGEDGDVVYLIYRTFTGQRPYVDFASGYTPGHYYFNAALLHAFGVDIRVLRWSLVLINSLAALCLYQIGAKALPPPLAAVPPLAYLALMPVYAGEFATFNIPYPAWHVVLFWAASLLAVLRSQASRRGVWLWAAGILAGLGCAFKPNTGAFNLAALAFVLLATAAPGRSWLSRFLWGGLLLSATAALLAVFGFRLLGRDARLLLWPALAVALLIAAAAPRLFAEKDGGFVRQPILLLAGFALVTLPWVSYYWATLGTQRFLHDVLFIGSGHEMFFYLGFPALDRWDGAMLAGTLGLAAASRVPPTRFPSPTVLATLGLALAALAGVGVWLAPMPEGFQRALTQRLEHLAYGTALIVHWAGVVLVGLRLRQKRSERTTAELAIAISAPLLFLSIYPRSDFFHWVLSAPLTLTLAVVLYSRLTAAWLPQTRASAAWAAVPVYAILLLVWFPGLSLASRLWVAPTPSFASLDLPRAPVALESGRAARLRDLRQTVEYIEAHSAPQQTLLGFPNLHFLNFLSGRQVPGRYGSFNPGWPDHTVEAQIVGDLDREKTPLVVINRSQQLYIGNAPVYYFLLKAYLQRHYRLAVSIGDYDILERREHADRGRPLARIEVEPGADRHVPTAEDTANADCAEAIDVVETRRSDTANALAACWRRESAPLQARAVMVARATADPAGAAALARALQDDVLEPRAALLAARAIGEAGDARSAPAAIAALDHLQGRVHDELITALLNVAVRSFFDSHQILPRPLGLDALRSDDRSGERSRAWLSSDDPRLQYVGAWIAGVRRDPGSVDALRRMLHHPALEFQALAANALLQLEVYDGVVEPLLDGMARDEMYLPTAVLEWSEANPERASAVLAERFRQGNPLQRESIAFVAGALGDASLAPVVRAGVSDAEPRVRMASLWAAGALHDEAARSLAEQAAAADPVAQVRDLARDTLRRLDQSGDGSVSRP